MGDMDCVPVLPDGISGRTRIIRLSGGGDCEPTMPDGISGRTRIIRLRDGDCVPDLPSGISGRTRIMRKADPGGADLTGCYDTFSRTVTGGWGEPDWCLPGWTDITASRNSVDGSVGVMDVTYYPSGPFTGAGGRVDFPVGAEGRTPGTIQFRMRYTGDSLIDVYLYPVRAWISPTGSSGATGAIVLGFEYLEDEWHDPPQFSYGFTDRRAYPDGGTWESDYGDDPYPSSISPSDQFAWWNVLVYVDDYGTYMRVWMDGEDEHARDAVTQPADYFGVDCPQGGGETWGAWEAYSIPQYEYSYFSFGIDQPGSSTAWEKVEIDNVRLGQLFCPCWYVVGSHFLSLDWPSEPRWGLLPYPGYGWPSGGSEVPRLLHGTPQNDDPAFTIIGPAVVGTADDWFPPDLAYPWGPVGEEFPDADWQLAVMVAQQSISRVRIRAFCFLSEGPPDYNDVAGTAWFGLYQNSLLVASIDTTTILAGEVVYEGAMNEGDRFFVVYQTDVAAPEAGGMQGVSWIVNIPDLD